MIPAWVIEAKRDGEALDPALLANFLDAYLRGEVPDYQMAAFLMAAYLKGLDDDETEVFVRCMLESGSTLDLSHLPGPRVDKHSTGGVGDKVSIALAPLAAASGVNPWMTPSGPTIMCLCRTPTPCLPRLAKWSALPESASFLLPSPSGFSLACVNPNWRTLALPRLQLAA